MFCVVMPSEEKLPECNGVRRSSSKGKLSTPLWMFQQAQHDSKALYAHSELRNTSMQFEYSINTLYRCGKRLLPLATTSAALPHATCAMDSSIHPQLSVVVAKALHW